MWKIRTLAWTFWGFAVLLDPFSTGAGDMDAGGSGAAINVSAEIPATPGSASTASGSLQPALPLIVPQPKGSFWQYPQSTERMLQNKGFEFHGFLKTEASTDFHSGFTGDGTDTRSLVETSLTLDLSKASVGAAPISRRVFTTISAQTRQTRLWGMCRAFPILTRGR